MRTRVPAGEGRCTVIKLTVVSPQLIETHMRLRYSVSPVLCVAVQVRVSAL
jgi:hypothetical protein